MTGRIGANPETGKMARGRVIRDYDGNWREVVSVQSGKLPRPVDELGLYGEGTAAACARLGQKFRESAGDSDEEMADDA